MKDRNVKSLESLAKTCKNGGVLPVFLGILVLFVGVINKAVMTMLAGLFIFIVGYAFVKIAGRLNGVLQTEREA
jgi:uncharacterized membrane protein HdeD (DUF308 family)